jgi:hypothetical protein
MSKKSKASYVKKSVHTTFDDSYGDNEYDYWDRPSEWETRKPDRTVLSTKEHTEEGWTEGASILVKEVEYSDGETEITRTTTYKDGKTFSYTTTKGASFGWARGRSYHDEFGTKTEGRSYSSSWSSRFGDNWYSGYSLSKIDSRQLEFSKILASVRRSANIVRNTEDNSEKEIEVHWADGKGKNRVEDNKIYISPDIADDKHTIKKSWNKDERVDVLIGDVLSQSAMKRTLDPGVEGRMISRAAATRISEKITASVWWSIESLAAEEEVMKDFPGFNGYFASQRAYYTDENAYESIQTALNEEETAVNACLALRWQMLHPEKNLSLPVITAKAIEESLKDIAQTNTSVKREEAAINISNRFCKLWPPPKNGEELEKQLISFLGESKIGMGEGDAPGEIVGNVSNVQESDEEKHEGAPAKTRIFEADNWQGGTIEVKKLRTNAATISRYQSMVGRLQPQIKALKNRLKLQNELTRLYEHGLKKGTLDEGSLYKLGYIRYGHSDNKIFEEKLIIDQPKLAVCLLVDESGSMNGSKINTARDMAVILVNGFKFISGVDLIVIGHTGQGGHHRPADHSTGYNEEMALHHYYTPENQNEASLARISAFTENLDGYAISKCGEYLLNWFPSHENRLLIHISDGEPAAGGYGGDAAMNHVKKVCAKLERFGVKAMGIGIDVSSETYEYMYGKTRSVIISRDVSVSLMPTVANIIVNAVGNMNKL